MTDIRATIEPLGTDSFALSFPYSDAMVARVRRLGNRRWNKRTRQWEIHLCHLGDVVEMFGLDPADKKAVGKYSLGMKQKLALSMAFLEDPKVLILDEPLSALDADSVQEARKRILEEKERGKLVLIASHYPEDIQSLCDEVYWMKSGHVLPSKENK